MASGTVRYRQWMDAIVERRGNEGERDDQLNKVVREALDKLEESERELVERRFLMGLSIGQISVELDCSERKLIRRLREVTLKLQSLLAPFVERRFNLKTETQRHCPICQCAKRKEAERIIAGKNEAETWRRIMRELRQRVGLKIDSPQTLIGHAKYHLTGA